MNNITQVFDEVNMFSNIWMSFATSTIGQWDMLEAYVSGGSFAIFIVFFRILDAVPAMNKYRLSPNTKPMPIVRPDQWKYNPWMPLLIYLAAIHLYHHFHPKPSPDISSPSVYRVVTEVILGIFAYDFIFFWIHYAMHVVPILSFMNHHVHHNQTTLSSSEVQHHSFLDGSFQVIVNILVQRIRTPFGPKHLLSRILHNVIITYMLTEIHGEFYSRVRSSNVSLFLNYTIKYSGV